MKKSLIEVIFMSEKRKKVLLVLKDGSMRMDALLEALNANRQGLLPQIRILEEHHLITKEGDMCSLTTIGEQVVKRMYSLLRTVEVLDNDVDYWGSRELSFIPQDLLDRLYELESCTIIEPDMSDLYEMNRKFSEKVRISESMNMVTTFLYPDFFELFMDYMKHEVKISLIVSTELADKIMTDYRDEFRELMQKSSINVFVSDLEIPFLSIAQNDHCVFLRLLKKELVFDSKQVMCCSQPACRWGKDFFNYYLEYSIPLTGI